MAQLQNIINEEKRPVLLQISLSFRLSFSFSFYALASLPIPFPRYNFEEVSNINCYHCFELIYNNMHVYLVGTF